MMDHMAKIGVNTFGLGPYLRQDAASVWKGLLSGGVGAVEPCAAFHAHTDMDDAYRAAQARGVFDGMFPVETAPALIASLRAMGFQVFSFQLQETPFSLDELATVLPFMEANGLHYCVYSLIDSSVERVRTMADTICQAVQMFQKSGVELLFHNHDMEWAEDQGTSVMEWLLENIPQLRFEIDLGWAQYAGVDPVALLRGYPNRFPLLHIKEIAKGAKAWSGSPFCTAPGEGILPLGELLKAASELSFEEVAILIDQDDSVSGNIVDDISRGVENICRIWEKYALRDPF